MQDFVNKLPDFFKPWGEQMLLNPFDFAGRTNKKDFWMTILVNLIIGIIPIVQVVSIVFSILSIPMCIRRLNDIGKSWPCIFFGLIPCVGPFILIYFYIQDSVA